MDIYKRARDLYGRDVELIKLAEECSELAQAALKIRGREDSLCHVNQLAEEIADVEMMIEQMRAWFNFDSSIEKMKEYKLKRLKDRMEKGRIRR